MLLLGLALACSRDPGATGKGGVDDETGAPASTGGGGEEEEDGGGEEEEEGNVCYEDRDGDGFGDPNASGDACDEIENPVATAGDCDDADPDVYPGSIEHCDGRDEDCDGTIDEDAADTSTEYRDADGDGYGDPDGAYLVCELDDAGVSNAEDCDDTDASIHPDAPEHCDGVDEDCDGEVDEEVDLVTTYYLDADADGYGDPSAPVEIEGCDTLDDAATTGDDCDDEDDAVHPGASEDCDAVDQDCDGTIDDGASCPCDLEHLGGHAYQFCTGAADWETARDACATNGYHLATIDDASENAWVDTTADTYSTDKWWMGLSDRDAEGTWAWEDATAVSYTNWESGEPNDSGGNEDCAQLNRYHPDQTWNDEPCSWAFAYVCEAD